MTGDEQLEIVQSERTGARSRIARGGAEITFGVIGFYAALKAVAAITDVGAAILVLTSLIAGLVGLSDVIEGIVRSVISTREIKQLTRLPAARVIKRLPP